MFMKNSSQIRFDPKQPQVLDQVPSAPKASSTRPVSIVHKKEGVARSDTASFSSFRGVIKDDHSVKTDKSKSRKAPTEEKIQDLSGERSSQLEVLIRKFSDDCKKCRVSQMHPQVTRENDTQRFITGSTYTGTCDILGMKGYGTYTFPDGIVYEGEFFDSCFHGNGALNYPDGTKLIGKWDLGVLKTKTLVFGDGLEYAEKGWKYCEMPDRRFTVESKTGLKPGTESFMTADQPTKPVPPGFYDTGEGFFDPISNGVFKYDCVTDAIRFVSPKEKAWIVENCRTNPDAPVGPKESLYERWMDPTQTDRVSEGASLNVLREPKDENYSATAWARMSSNPSVVPYFGGKPFIKFDPQNTVHKK